VAETNVRHQWLDLVETDGPFLSRPALVEQLDDTWPRRLDRETRSIVTADDPRPARSWDEVEGDVDRFLLDVLGYETGKTLDTSGRFVPHRTYEGAGVHVHAMCTTIKGDPRMVVVTGTAAAPTPADLEPTTRVHDHGWRSTPVDRAAMAARHVGADLALVTDGHRHLIVWVGSGMVGWGYVDPKNHRLDRRLADATVGILSAARVTSRRTGESTADLLRASEAKQVDLTDKLGIQVRRAAEALVNAVSRANRDTDGELLDGVDGRTVYAGVVTVLMRTVFLLNAEEQGLIGDGDLYEQSYAVSTLLDRLDEDHYRHPGVMRHRHGAWARLLATTRAVHGGVTAPKLDTDGNAGDEMHVYRYGGGLFDPSRHPFLEGIGPDGMDLEVGVVDDFTIRHVLDLLQRLNGQRLSYRTFSVEQIGQVYEHLLDHNAVTVAEDDVVLGLVGPKGREPEVSLSGLEANHGADTKLAKWLAEHHDTQSGENRETVWLNRIERAPDERVTSTITRACRNDQALLTRIGPYLGLLDADARGDAKVFLPGDVYVTETSSRRDSGTSYTPPDFAAEIAKHALRHLVYAVDLDTDDDPDTSLKHPDDILKLNICDPAVGSGAIIVAAVRYLADRLHAARIEHNLIDPDADTTAAESLDTTDDRVQARRDVVANCIYAVDRDPMAVEMTKLSLWLITMAHNRPFTFIDHAIRCGDALLGVSDLGQLRRLHLDREPAVDLVAKYPLEHHAYLERIDTVINDAIRLRHQVQAGDVLDAKQAAQRANIAARADAALDRLRPIADALVATCYATAAGKKGDTEAAIASDVITPVINDDGERLRLIGHRRPADCTGEFSFFHWALEFPEVVGSGGFDAVVGNPPFRGGSLISGDHGDNYRAHIVRYAAAGDTGTANLVSYFFRRIAPLTRTFGLISTNSLPQGFSRRVGLLPLVHESDAEIYRAISSRPWTGRDNVHVSFIWWSTDPPRQRVLDATSVLGIESDLYPVGAVRGEAFAFPARAGLAGEGQKPYGRGFVLDEQTASEMIAEDPRNADVVFKYVSGKQVNKTWNHATDRWVINFHDWDVEQAREYPAPYEVIETEVKPVRAKDKREQRRDYWWRYGEYRGALVGRISQLTHTIGVAKVSPYAIPTLLPTNVVFADKVILFPWDDLALYGLLTSTVHRIWIDRYTGTMKKDISYSPADSFNKLPLPGHLSATDQPRSDGLAGRGPSEQEALADIADHMDRLHHWRATQMKSVDTGLTKIYGQYHDPEVRDEFTHDLRQMHVQLDTLVVAAYGWNDIDLGHGFHDTRYGTFFTFSTKARFELLMRLLELNFVQYAEQTGKSLEQVKREAQGG
jgi:hypothetical protein